MTKTLYRCVWIVSGALLSGCAIYRSCGLSGCPGDKEITASVQKLFTEHPVLMPPNLITVQTYGHVVYLYGVVDTELERDIATEVARHAPGATRVVNSIGIAGNR